MMRPRNGKKSVRSNRVLYPIQVSLLSLSSGFFFVPVAAADAETADVEAEAATIDKSSFYSPPTTFDCNKDVVVDFGADQAAGREQSERFQDAVDDAANCEGDALLTVPAGQYYLKGIRLKSNVHIQVDKEAILLPASRTQDRSNSIFELGIDVADGIRNVSITGKETGFTIDLRNGGRKESAISLGEVENFYLANFQIKDDKTIFSSIIFQFNTRRAEIGYARNGTVRNVHQTGADIGYGLVQTHAMRHILFDDISSEGGVALRLETDDRRMRNLGQGGVDEVYALNVGCSDGLAAVMLSPHFMTNGSVTIEGVQADSCGYAVRAEAGFVEFLGKRGQTRKQVQDLAIDHIGVGSVDFVYPRDNGLRFAARIKPSFADAAFEALGLRAGSFESVEISDIVSQYGTKSQYHDPVHRYLSCTEQFNDICRAEVGEIRGASIAAVSDMASRDEAGGFEIITTNVNAVGYPVQTRTLITSETELNICPRRLVIKACNPQ